jgi:hypothetical protein
MASMTNAELESSEMSEIKKRWMTEGMDEAMALDRGDHALWTVTDTYTCPNCGHNECKYMQTIGTNKKEDQSDEPVITVSYQKMSIFNLEPRQTDEIEICYIHLINFTHTYSSVKFYTCFK